MHPHTSVYAERFHGSAYAELAPWAAATEIRETRYFVVQERAVSYRFSLHQHPYVQQLVQRLLRAGTPGLQAADTEYAPRGASLPGSMEVALDDVGVSLPPGSRIALLAGLQATSGGIPIELDADLELQFAGAAAVQATLPDGMRAALVDGMEDTPPAGAVFTLSNDRQAVAFAATRVVLTAAASVALYDGTQATLPGGSQVLLARGSRFTIPGGRAARLLKSRPRPVLYAPVFSPTRYHPSTLVELPYPVKDLDFSSGGAYAAYNWELFFHVPLTIGIHLSKNQRFAEAQRWFHYLFDPTDDSDGPTPERFWKVRPFQSTDVMKIEEVLVNLATGADPALQQETVAAIGAWKEAPFRPHAVARFRQQAYMYRTVMAYLDNLIAWGDSLFAQDTGEAVDEALMVYVLAANILGPRPLQVPKKGTVRPQTYASLRHDLTHFGTALRGMEAEVPFDLMPFPGEGGDDDDRLATLRSLGKALYFCVPRNARLLGYWDTVADRLFKIHNSLNFQGNFRQMALFEPPIDPALLARAAAAGLDVGAVVNGLNQPLPLVRFALLVQKAAEIAQEVKSLGNHLLSTMEKEDGEALALLRARHERAVMVMAEHVKYGQLQEAVKSTEGLRRSLALAIQRYTYYEKQLGTRPEDIEKVTSDAIEALGDVDPASLEKMNFAMTEPEPKLREITVDIATDAFAQVAQVFAGGALLSSHEVRETLLLEGAQVATDIASVLNVASSIASVVPQFEVSAKPWGVGGSTTFGGQNVAAGISAAGNAARGVAERMNFEARRASRIDSFDRRKRDWTFQSNLAAGEISQIFKQLRAAQLREAVATLDLKSHRKQMEHGEAIERFLNEEGTTKGGKKTNRALYAWMKREVKGLYAQSFQLAFDVARRAERALRHELGDPGLSYLQFGYLAGKEGLLAGERLYLDIKRMETAYHELNQREYELTRHVSLLQVDPMALLLLRSTGRCTMKVPEGLFDMDGPGHYFRRIKTVAVSVPCVIGPYSGVNCRVTLLKSSIRTTPVLRDSLYAREDAEDDRFNDYFGSLQSIVTNSSQNDSGLFETNLRDERYLPFENSGAISEWQIELPANPGGGDPRQFDYDTISDVILHIRYTAREGGDLLRDGARKELRKLIDGAGAAGSVRLFSVRHEFPTEWAKFQGETPSTGQRHSLALALRPEHYPFWSQGRLGSVHRVDILARSSRAPVPARLEIFGLAERPGPAGLPEPTDVLELEPTLGGLLAGELKTGSRPARPDDALKLFFTDTEISDLWVAVRWGAQPPQ